MTVYLLALGELVSDQLASTPRCKPPAHAAAVVAIGGGVSVVGIAR
jgi:uncharacterized membrane protein